MLDSLTSFLLLPLGAALGYAIGRNNNALGSTADASQKSMPLVDGNLQHNLSDSSDPADDELNLTVGALFRKRGEIDSALRLHEGILAHVAHKPDLRPLVLLELGQDYAKAGLTDRAEAALKECATHPSLAISALEHLLPIHEQHGNWPEAIEVAQQLQSLRGASTAYLCAHYWCELAEAASADKKPNEALSLVSKALEADPNCIRANFFLSRHLHAMGRLPDALEVAVRIPEKDERFLPEVLPLVQSICAHESQADTFLDLLNHFEGQYGQEPALWLARAAQLEPRERIQYLASKLAQRPSWKGLVEFLKLPVLSDADLLKQPVSAFSESLGKLVAKRPRYRCTHCGFTPSLLFWKCPSCKQWGSIIPIEDTL